MTVGEVIVPRWKIVNSINDKLGGNWHEIDNNKFEKTKDEVINNLMKLTEGRVIRGRIIGT